MMCFQITLHFPFPAFIGRTVAGVVGVDGPVQGTHLPSNVHCSQCRLVYVCIKYMWYIDLMDGP